MSKGKIIINAKEVGQVINAEDIDSVVYNARPPLVIEDEGKSPFDPNDERAALQKRLEQHKSNLSKLREQEAIYAAGETPLQLLNKIEREEAEITRIQAELKQLEG